MAGKQSAYRFAGRAAIALSLGLLQGVSFAACLDNGMQVQILGSGGPGASGGRASAGYVVWIDGTSRIMVDAGSGTKDQFHRSGASLGDIELFAISHFHPDHSSELPAILWPAGTQALLAGPQGSPGFPSVSEYTERMFGENGVFPVLGERMENLGVLTVNATGGAVSDVWSADGIRVRGTGVPHADVPTVGYRIDYGGASVVFTSDQNGSDQSFIEFIDGVDLLVIHMTVGEDSASQLHARPSVWGQMAENGNVGRVVVSHIGTGSDEILQQRVGVLRENYDGPVTVGEDLMCVEIDS